MTVGGMVLAGSFAPSRNTPPASPQVAATTAQSGDSLESDSSIPPRPQLTYSVPTEPTFAAMTDAQAWARLPDRTAGQAGPLPAWARVLAGTLPRTTAAMLELDYQHRAGAQLALDLRGLVRWAAARAGRCAYGEAYALADLRAAGLGPLADRLAAGNLTGLPPEQRAAVKFADGLTADPRSVTDAEVAALIGQYGERQVVAMVLLLAYAQFQDRLALVLGVAVEPGGPVPPLAVRFARRPFGIVTAPPPRRPATGPVTTPAPDGPPPAGWRTTDLDHIRCSLDEQRARRPRIRLPAEDPSANRWGLVGQTYQPELADAWSACTQAFGEEADQDAVFEQSLFWVVTQTKGCFY
jgi:alkylhydroperoxidase family enzyme